MYLHESVRWDSLVRTTLNIERITAKQICKSNNNKKSTKENATGQVSRDLCCAIDKTVELALLYIVYTAKV